MPRCVHCGRRIWPWQRVGWLVVEVSARGETVHWHAKCGRFMRRVQLPVDGVTLTWLLQSNEVNRVTAIAAATGRPFEEILRLEVAAGMKEAEHGVEAEASRAPERP